MKKLIPVGLILAPSLAFAQANGSISLNTPQTFTAPPSISSYTPSALHIDRTPQPKIYVRIVSNDANAQQLIFTYPDDCQPIPPSITPVCSNLDTDSEVLALIDALNTVNLTTRSLWRRVFDRLVADFPSKFPGGAVVQ